MMRHPPFWQQIGIWISNCFQRSFWRRIVSPEIVAIVFLCTAELSLLLLLLRPSTLLLWLKWILTCIWIFFPGFHIDTSPMTFLLFCELPFYLFGLVAFPWLGVRLIQNIIIEWRIEKQLAAWNVDYAIRRGTTLLTALRVEAQFEQEKRRIWKIRHYDPTLSQAEDSTLPLKIAPFAGVASFFYCLLAFLFQLPRDEKTGRGEENVANTPTIPQNKEIWTLSSEPFSRSSSLPPRMIFLFDELRIRIVGSKDITLSVKLPRQRELLAYLAVPARERPTDRGMILDAVYEERSEKDDWLGTHQVNLSNDAKALRSSIKLASQRVGIAYMNPILVDDHGPHAAWKLSDAYEVVDVTRIDMLEQRLKDLRYEERKSLQEAHMLREVYTPLIEAYRKGFLGQYIAKKDVGKWANEYHVKYRTKYRQILWDLATYESQLGETLRGGDQHESFQRSAALYKEYAFLTLPRDEAELERDGQAKLNEQALQQCMTMYRKDNDVVALRRVYHEYSDRMKRRFPTWKVDPQTQKVLVDEDQDILPSH